MGCALAVRSSGYLVLHAARFPVLLPGYQLPSPPGAQLSAAILQIDIEGSEWQVFDEFFRANATIPFSQILIELHVPTIPRHWGSDARHRLRCANISCTKSVHARSHSLWERSMATRFCYRNARLATRVNFRCSDNPGPQALQ